MREERNINNTERQYIDDQCYGFQFRWLISNWVRERNTKNASINLLHSTTTKKSRYVGIAPLRLQMVKIPPWPACTDNVLMTICHIFIYKLPFRCCSSPRLTLDCNFFFSFSSGRVVSCHKNISHSNSKSEVTWEASSRFSTDDGGKAENYTLTISWLDDCCELPVFIFCCVRIIAKEDINRVGRKKESWAEVGRCTKPKTVVKNHVHFGTIGNHVAPTEFALFCNSTRSGGWWQ